MNCKQCGGTNQDTRIIDERGREYCGEQCLDQYYENNDLDTDEHPYFDDYRAIRTEYIGILSTWKSKLNGMDDGQEFAADDFLDDIDEIISQYWDYVITEGDDGPYAHEIYSYVMKFEKLQKDILEWRPKRWTYHVFSSYVHDSSKLLHSVENELNEKDEETHKGLFQHLRPYREGYHLVFDYDFELENALEFVQETFEKHEADFSTYKAYRCDGGCGDVVDLDDVRPNRGGWVYCDTCEEKYPFIFTPDELLNEINEVEKDEREVDRVMFERQDWCHFFKRKIRRSCRFHNVEIPAWAARME